eukprot:5252072-Ditylum_brightwellii.AAC.1
MYKSKYHNTRLTFLLPRMSTRFSTISHYVKVSTSLFNANQNPFGGKSLEYTGGDDPNSKNYVKLTEALNTADTERRKAEEEALKRERAAEMRREERLRKIAYMADMPDSQPAGTVDEFMFKEGVQDQLDKLDNDLVGLVPVKKRVKEIAALLVLDKMRRKLGFETS